ncbi:MAG: hypothetical protein IKN78_12950 [Bacteroidales bacterium]|nr:hypothetical protein [Bacteroidales bacterium]
MNKEVWTKSRRVQDARHLSNPTRNERSECRVGYAMGMRSCVSETHYYSYLWHEAQAGVIKNVSYRTNKKRIFATLKPKVL